MSIEEQGFIANQGVEVMVATPGRLNDALDRRYLVLKLILLHHIAFHLWLRHHFPNLWWHG